jgi:serine/threonine-protein kinase
VVPLALGPPKHLGRYEVGAKIGGGGMATVYVGRAVRDDGEEELVALKVIRDELATDPQFEHMFIDEAKILASLSHPNVIHTLEYGVTGNHRFIAMELLSGRTYADVWDLLVEQNEPMPLRLGAWICARVAEGLHSAHELLDEDGLPLNVIHRDVNPTNVFLTHSGEVKLIDFGLAKARRRMSKSADGIVKGKIPYLAPEQAQGKPIDRRIDVYSLGTTLWETAAMKRLFKRDTDVDTLLAIREAKVPDVRTMREGFPEALWGIIERALRVDADDRFQTAKEMQDALDAFVGDASDMKRELAALLARLFPGQEAKQAKWMRDATHVRVPQRTMPPPVPVPIASSTLLGDDESAPSLPSIKVSAAADASSTAETPEESAATVPKSRRFHGSTSTRASRPASEPPAAPAPDEAPEPSVPPPAPKRERENVQKLDEAEHARTSDAPRAARQAWIWVVVALAALGALVWAIGR